MRVTSLLAYPASGPISTLLRAVVAAVLVLSGTNRETLMGPPEATGDVFMTSAVSVTVRPGDLTLMIFGANSVASPR